MTALKRYNSATSSWEVVGLPLPVTDKADVVPTYTVDYSPKGSNPANYYLIKVFKQPGTRPIKKVYSFDTDDPVVAVSNKETLTSFATRKGSSIIVNAGAWTLDNKMRGVQIKDGVIVQSSWEREGDVLGNFVLASMRDGSMKVYRYPTTAATMLAEGAMDTWSHSAVILDEGVLEDNSGVPAYTYKTAQNIVGCDINGNYMILQSAGVSGSSGYTMQEIATLAQSLGFYTAVSLDGGGSCQSMVGGTKLLVSSDPSKQRAVPDFISINAERVASQSNSWVYPSHNGTGMVRYRPVFGQGSGRGYVEIDMYINNGINSGGVVFTLPEELRPSSDLRIVGASNTNVGVSLNVLQDGSVAAISMVGFDNTRAIIAYGRIPLD